MHGYYDRTCPCPCCGQPLPKFEQLRVHRPARTAIRRGRTAQLTPTELRVLLVLMESRIELDRRSLISAVYADDPTGGPDCEHSIYVHLAKLRRKLAPLGVEIKNNMVIQR